MPPPPSSLENAGTWVGGGTACAVLLSAVMRFLMKTYRTDRMESTVNAAESSTFERLQREIKRLESIINGKQHRIDLIEFKLCHIRNNEIYDAADISELTVLLRQLPCKGCNNVDAYVECKSVLARLAKRIRGTHVMLREDSDTEEAVFDDQMKNSDTETK